MKLNLGGAGEGFISGRIPGFSTVDLREGPDTDVVADISNLSMFENGSVEEIYSSNVLEHFSLTKTLDVLKEWNRVLKPKGRMWLSVPDFNACVTLYKVVGLTEWVKYLIWGDQKHPLNYHYINFTFITLSKNLLDAGFSDVERVKSFPFGIKDASEHKDNILHIPISLNVKVTK